MPDGAPPLPPMPAPPVEVHSLVRDVARAERAILGAMVTGALALPDVAGLEPAAFLSLPLRRGFGVLLTVLELRAERIVPNGIGIPLPIALKACEADGVMLGGVYGPRRICAGTLADLARDAPRAPGARQAVRDLRADYEYRRQLAADVCRGLTSELEALLWEMRFTGEVTSGLLDRLADRYVKQTWERP